MIMGVGAALEALALALVDGLRQHGVAAATRRITRGQHVLP